MHSANTNYEPELCGAQAGVNGIARLLSENSGPVGKASGHSTYGQVPQSFVVWEISEVGQPVLC